MFGRPFSQEIVQHLMKQIIEAFKCLHSKNLVHNNIKINNILINFDDENEKEKLNMIKATAKITNFKFSCRAVTLKDGVFNALNKDIKEEKSKFTEKDKKIDILQLGIICYKILFGKFGVEVEPDKIEKIMDEIGEGKIIIQLLYLRKLFHL